MTRAKQRREGEFMTDVEGFGTLEEAAPNDPAYAYRPSVFGGMCAFRAAPGRLYWEIGRHSGDFAYSAIRRIRLSFRPVNLANQRYIAEIWAEGVPKLTVASTSWKSIVEQERRDGDYAAFIRALHARIAASGADPELIVGSPALIYWPGVAVMALMIAAFPVIIWRTAQAGASLAAVIIAAFMAYCCWQLGTFFYRNRPGRYALEALPAAVMPKE
jgi:hypothetical protein